MRTSGGRGSEGWIMAIPIIALLVVASTRSGGLAPALYELNSAILQIWTAIMEFVQRVL